MEGFELNALLDPKALGAALLEPKAFGTVVAVEPKALGVVVAVEPKALDALVEPKALGALVLEPKAVGVLVLEVPDPKPEKLPLPKVGLVVVVPNELNPLPPNPLPVLLLLAGCPKELPVVPEPKALNALGVVPKPLLAPKPLVVFEEAEGAVEVLPKPLPNAVGVKELVGLVLLAPKANGDLFCCCCCCCWLLPLLLLLNIFNFLLQLAGVGLIGYKKGRRSLVTKQLYLLKDGH